MIGNQAVSTMFEFDTCNHMVRFVLLGKEIEDFGCFLHSPGCDGVCIFLWHIDPLCMFRGYVISIIYRTDPQCIQVAVLHYDCMDPQCMIGGHDLCFWCHQFMIWVWECLPQELVYMIFCWCLDVCRSLIRCAFGSWHTHAAYKVYRLSLVPLSDFGGHSVIHNFGHCDDVMVMLWW